MASPMATLLAAAALLLAALPSARPDPIISSVADPCPARSDGDPTLRSCPVKCFLTDPVCGADGVTYWCGCPEAACAGARVAKRGVCQVGNGGSGPIAGQAFLLLHIVFLIGLGFAFLFDVL